MSRPKLEVTHVWVLEEVLPYEGTEVTGVFFDVEVAKQDPEVAKRLQRQPRWRKRPDGGWTTRPASATDMREFFSITKYEIH